MAASLSIFRANDIRGVYKKDFDLNFCKDLAKSISYLLKEHLSISKPKILIGYDARLSSPEIATTLKKALLKEGVSVCLIGVAPSPLCYFLLEHYQLSATIVVTASHNPPKDNGFKILVHKKYKLPETINLLKNFYKHSSSLKPSVTQGLTFEMDSTTPYISSLKKEFSLKPIPFVVDMGNGALGPLAQKVFKSLGLSPEILFLEPDGRFPNHHPDPTLEKNLKVLKKRVRENSFCFGASFDGDGDRLVLVTKEGRTVLGDELASLFLPSLLEKQSRDSKHSPIIADVKCSDWLFKSIKQSKGKVIMSQSGHRLIRQEMEKRKAIAAFEFSGHVFFNDRKNRGFDDALYACLRILEILNQGESLTALLPKRTTARTGEIRIPLKNKKITTALEEIKKYFTKRKESFLTLDGIRVSRKTSWALFRSSKTQESLTMRFEASNERDLLKFKEEISSVINIPIE